MAALLERHSANAQYLTNTTRNTYQLSWSGSDVFLGVRNKYQDFAFSVLAVSESAHIRMEMRDWSRGRPTKIHKRTPGWIRRKLYTASPHLGCTLARVMYIVIYTHNSPLLRSECGEISLSCHVVLFEISVFFLNTNGWSLLTVSMWQIKWLLVCTSL